jgi:hypothetical protein
VQSELAGWRRRARDAPEYRRGTWVLLPSKGHVSKVVAHLQHTLQRPLLVGDDHDQRTRAGKFAQPEGSAQVTLTIAGAHFQLESLKARNP